MALLYWAPDILKLIWDLYSDEANHHLPASFHWFYKDSAGWRAECFPLTCDLISIGLISRAVPAILPANIVTSWIYPVIWTIHFLYKFCMYFGYNWLAPSIHIRRIPLALWDVQTSAASLSLVGLKGWTSYSQCKAYAHDISHTNV